MCVWCRFETERLQVIMADVKATMARAKELRLEYSEVHQASARTRAAVRETLLPAQR